MSEYQLKGISADSVTIDEAAQYTETPVEPTPVVETPHPWPTTADFMNEETQAESVAFAAYEILSIQAGLIKSLMRLHSSPIPPGCKAFFEKKVHGAVAQLYAGIPNQIVPMVEWMVMEEQLGGPEAVAKMQAELEAARSGVVVSTGSTAASNTACEGSNPSDPAIGVVDGTVPPEAVTLVSQEQDGSSPSNVTILPKIPEQWPVQLGADNQLHIVKEPERPLAKVLQFKPRVVAQPTGPQDDPPPSGSPIAIAA